MRVNFLAASLFALVTLKLHDSVAVPVADAMVDAVAEDAVVFDDQFRALFKNARMSRETEIHQVHCQRILHLYHPLYESLLNDQRSFSKLDNSHVTYGIKMHHCSSLRLSIKRKNTVKNCSKEFSGIFKFVCQTPISALVRSGIPHFFD